MRGQRRIGRSVLAAHGESPRSMGDGQVDGAGLTHKDKTPDTQRTYEFDPHLDLILQWAGKAEGMSFDVPTSSIHIHESIKPHKMFQLS